MNRLALGIPSLFGPIGLLVLLGLAIFWVIQFVQLMQRPDDSSTGRHDKLIWVVVFLFIPLLAPFAYLVWKRAR